MNPLTEYAPSGEKGGSSIEYTDELQTDIIRTLFRLEMASDLLFCLIGLRTHFRNGVIKHSRLNRNVLVTGSCDDACYARRLEHS